MEQKMKAPRVDQELNGMLFFLEILGLQYFSLRSSMKEKRPVKMPSLFRGVHFIITLLLQSALMVGYIFSDTESLEKQVTAKNILTYTIQNSMKIGMLAVIIVSAAQSFISTRKIKAMYLNMQKLIDLSDADFGVHVDFNGIRHNAKRNTAAVSIFFLLTHGTMIVLEAMSSLERSLYILMGAPPIIFLLSTVFKFIFYVHMINAELDLLKKLIEGIFNVPKVTILEKDINFIPVKAARDSESPFRKFVSAKKIYNMIYENAVLVNDSMGLTVLMLLIATVITLTASGYEMFVILVEQKMKEKIPGEKCRSHLK
jgi:hypothetical protein